jgi:hypothetical protein
MEVLATDVPFSSPYFRKTNIFDHPDVRSVEYGLSPLPHYYIVGTPQAVNSLSDDEAVRVLHCASRPATVYPG